MKHQNLSFLLTLPALLVALSAQAHDPKEHMKGADTPDCAAMKDMDHAKMDRDDPVMQAMMKKCMGSMHQGKEGAHKGHTDKGHPKETADEEMPARHPHNK